MSRYDEMLYEIVRFYCPFCKTTLNITELELEDHLSSSGACRVCGDKNWHVYHKGEILI